MPLGAQARRRCQVKNFCTIPAHVFVALDVASLIIVSILRESEDDVSLQVRWKRHVRLFYCLLSPHTVVQTFLALRPLESGTKGAVK